MKDMLIDISKRAFPFILMATLGYSVNRCTQYKQVAQQATTNLKVAMDTITNIREVNGKVFAENLVLSLTSNELKATNTKLSQDIKSLSNRNRRPLNGTSVRIVHDTIFVEKQVADSSVSFAYSDSCIDMAVDSGMLVYQIKPIEVTIIQRKEGNKVIASASYSGCGSVVGVSSIIVEDKPKRKIPWFWIGVGSGVVLRSVL